MLLEAGTGVAIATAPKEMLEEADRVVEDPADYLKTLATGLTERQGCI
jgi:hydroxymethylpyrimidine pyrophosphatase-like HAD family hydrolase